MVSRSATPFEPDARESEAERRTASASDARAPKKPALLHWSEAWSLSAKETHRAFDQHLNPGLFRVLERLGYASVQVVAARGFHYIDSAGSEILDFWGGFGTLNVGHNHPRLAAVRRAFDEAERPELVHAFVPAQAALLAKNLARVLPAELDVSYLCCTGSEAVEAALKLAQKLKQNPAGRLLFADGAMHGKTHGALSVTGNERVKQPFKSLPNCSSFRFGDPHALASALRRTGSGAGFEPLAVIIEPIQSGAGVIVPPAGYLRRVRQLCDEHRALMIVDEVQTGFGRTGRLFGFEHDDIVPDVVVLSKAMGGGKVPIAAYVTRGELFRKAYGSTADATLHNATFNGMGSAAAVATEVLHIIYDEGLIENAARVGSYLRQRLEAVADKYPDLVADVRGRGLLLGIELRNLTELLPASALSASLPRLRALGDGPLAVLVAARMLLAHRVLVAFTDFDRNVLRLEPPLGVSEEHADLLVDALDQTLGLGVKKLVGHAISARLGHATRPAAT